MSTLLRERPAGLRRRTGKRRFVLLLTALCLGVMIVRFSDRSSELIDPLNTFVPEGIYKVERVTADGTLLLLIESNGQTQRAEVGFIGISIVDAQSVVKKLRKLEGEKVRLRFDRRRLDEKQMLIAYVFSGDQLWNETLVRSGIAKRTSHAADSATMVRQIKRAETDAQENSRGIWRSTNEAQPES